MAGFFDTRWQSQQHVGGLHPASPDQPLSPAELHRQYQMVHDALSNGALDPEKVSVVTHPDRLDTWYVRYRNATHEVFKDAEIIGWLVFDYHGKRGKGQEICRFPDNPPIIGMLTPTDVFTDVTGSKWLCLAGYGGGTMLGQKEAMRTWKAVFHDDMAPQQGNLSITEVCDSVVQVDGGHHF